MVPCILLAAGASTRMGRPKALLTTGGKSFIRKVLEDLRDGGVSSAAVVIRPGQPEIAAEVSRAGFGEAVENPRPDEGQLSSLLVGLDAVDRPDVDGVLVTLVDVPMIGAESVRALLERARASRSPVLRAVHGGRHGHPVLFKRELFDALRHADPALGAKDVLRRVTVEDVEVAEPGVVIDIDTPADYDRLPK
jgi:molybdenum cofactor cytidylyltransferase